MNLNKLIERIKSDEVLVPLIKYVENFAQGCEVYLVGGTIREFLLEKENFDKDIAVFGACAEKFAQSLAEKLGATFVTLDEVNKIYRLVLPDKINYLDIAQILANSVEEDLKRRDFTLNSIAVNLKTFEIIDVTGGLADLKSGLIRHISEQNFIDDPLRLLRAYRFESSLGFVLDGFTKELIAKHASRIKLPAVERVSYELIKLFSGAFCSKTLVDMDETGILEEILPISCELKKVPPNLHHHLDLFFHSIETVNQVEKIYENSPAKVREHLEKTDFGGISRLAHLKLAAFLHDIGKPSTWTIEEGSNRHRFIKHDDIGSKMGKNILKNLKFSKKQIDYITKMIKNHIYPSHVVCAPELNDKICMRFIRKMGEDSIDVLVLAMADRYSALGVEITKEIVEKNISNLQKLLDFYLEVKDTMEPLPKLISGNEIMEILKIKPSPELGEIIKKVQEAQISGEINTKEDAVALIKSCKPSH